MLNKKIVSVLAVTLMLTMGIGIVFVGNDQSEAVTSLSPYGEVEKQADELLTMCGFDIAHATSSVTAPRPVANGTYINILSSIDTQSDVVYDVSDVNNTAQSPGQSAMGIAINSNGCAGTVDANVSSFTIGIVVIINQSTEPEDFPVDVTFNVVDLSSSANTPYTNLEVPARLILTKSDWYLDLSATVDCPVSVGTNVPSYRFQSVTPGFGLSVSMIDELEGTTTSGGDATVTIENQSNSTTQTVTFHISASTHADVRMIGGETWTYTPTTNMTSVLSISGTATSWVSLSGGVVSGTAPTNTSVGQTYDLTITASTSDPNQNVTQTVTFTVDPQITLTAPATETIQYGTDVGDWLGSNFEDGTRSIYSITGGTATGFTVSGTTAIVEWSNPTSGTIIFTATSPYTYTSGATNTATATVDVTVTGILTASVSGTLYLVTGKTVPNTPAEAVTLNHNDVGVGTYTWAVVGTNNSGVTVASDGTLGGTPGNIGTYAVTVRCTSVVGSTTQTADTTLNIVIVQVLAFTSSPSSGTIR